MSDADLLAACRDIAETARSMRWLATVWWGAFVASLIVAIAFGAMYHYGVRFRIPRKNAALKRLARERDIARVEREAAIANLADESARCAAALGAMRLRLEELGLQAQKDITEADDRAKRERAIRKKTEAALIEQKDLAQTMEGLLTAMNMQTIAPGKPDSWVPDFPDQASGS
jgi:Skp family chaperone for outer membrane proteins